VLVAGLVWGGVTVGRLAVGSEAPDAAAASLPVLTQIPPRFDGTLLAWRLDAAGIPLEARDELLSSPVLRDPEFAQAVHWWVEYWRVSATRWFPGFLERMAVLGGTVDSALAEHDLPPSLRYLPLIESGYDPRVTSSARAVGLWQLMSPTALGLGLEVSELVDERRHPEKSTEAALEYLRHLHDEFDSWFISLAAYNSGPTRVRGILRRHAPGEPRTDSLFWALRHHFAPETRDFLPKLYGAMWVASRPEAYGYEAPLIEPWAFDAVSVPATVALEVVARAAEVSADEVTRLNPELLRGVTPPGRRSSVRIPPGRGGIFMANYPLITAAARAALSGDGIEP
jgi:membrane-bound lytic murein transglycosylase D